jgi:hypothetical protein
MSKTDNVSIFVESVKNRKFNMSTLVSRYLGIIYEFASAQNIISIENEEKSLEQWRDETKQQNDEIKKQEEEKLAE